MIPQNMGVRDLDDLGLAVNAGSTGLENGSRSSYSATVNALTNTLIEEIKAAPDAVQREVFDFLVFLKTREAAREEGRENLLPLAQTAWGADWNLPEEEEAWRDL